MRPLIASVLIAAPAVACINDSELPTHEREFRSSYQADHKPATSRRIVAATLHGADARADD